VEFQQVVAGRRMVRSFEDRPLDPESLDRILANALRGPSAGFSQGFAFLVLEGAEDTGRFWELASEEAWRAEPDWPGLLRAPVVIVPLSHRQAYLDRYAKSDKEGLAGRIPVWIVDTAFSVMLILLSAIDAGLGALFFGLNHADESALLRAFGVPAGFEPVGAIALGHPAADDRPSASLRRGHRPPAEMIHRGRW
jgi:nitroreductase